PAGVGAYAAPSNPVRILAVDDVRSSHWARMGSGARWASFGQLATSVKSWPGKVVLIKVNGESNDAARERHYRAHPEDRGSDYELFLVIVQPKRGEDRWSQDRRLIS